MTRTVKLLWHPQVHSRFNETLYFYAVSTTAVSSEFLSDVKHITHQLGIGGRCIYEVFGEVDYLLRLWLNPNAAAQLYRWFSSYGLQQLGVFRVTKQFHWKFTATLSESALNLLQPSDIKKAQQGDRATIERLVTLGACVEDDIQQGIKFFITVPPPSRATLPVLERLERKLRDARPARQNQAQQDEPIFQKSAYFGDGFTWALLKGVTRDVCDISTQIEAVRREIAALLMKTTTLVCSERTPDETEHISDGSLDLWLGPPDMRVMTWLPQLYEQPLFNADSRKGFESVAHVVLEQYANGAISDEDLQSLREYLTGVISQDARLAAQPLAYLFLTVEGRLRSRWTRIADAEVELAQQLCEQCRITDPRRLHLYELLSLFIAFGKKKAISGFNQAGQLASRIRDLRNDVVHGQAQDKVISDWRSIMDLVLDYLKLHATIMALGDERQKSTDLV